MSTSTAPALTPAVRSARLGTYVIFGLNGLVFASWASRLPSVATTLDLTPGGLGLLLLLIGLGSVLGLPLAGHIVDKIGTANAVRFTGALLGTALLVIAVSLLQSWLAPVAVSLFFFGFGIGVWDVSQNIEGAEVERRVGKTIMPKFHAAFSGGAFVGAMIGSLLAKLQIDLPIHLIFMVAAGAVVVFFCTRAFLPAHAHTENLGDAPETPRRRSAAWREPRTLLIGLVVLGAAFTEGAANDWVAKATVDGLHTSESVGAIMFAVFVAAMTGFRFAGSALLDRFGRVIVLRICLSAALLGLVVFVLAPYVWLAAIGAVLWGIGAALGFPVGMSAAADDPRHAAARVAVVSTIGYAAFLVGPPLLGFVGDHVGVRNSLLVVFVVVLASLLTTSAVRPRPAS